MSSSCQFQSSENRTQRVRKTELSLAQKPPCTWHFGCQSNSEHLLAHSAGASSVRGIGFNADSSLEISPGDGTEDNTEGHTVLETERHTEHKTDLAQRRDQRRIVSRSWPFKRQLTFRVGFRVVLGVGFREGVRIGLRAAIMQGVGVTLRPSV